MGQAPGEMVVGRLKIGKTRDQVAHQRVCFAGQSNLPLRATFPQREFLKLSSHPVWAP